MPPAKKTSTKKPQPTEAEIEARNEQDRARNKELISVSNRYPARRVVELGEAVATNALVEAIGVENDKSAFFSDTMTRRVCSLHKDYLSPACHDSTVEPEKLHECSFAVKASEMQAHVDNLDDAMKSVVQSLSERKILETDHTGMPTMEKVGDSTRKRPTVKKQGSSYSLAQAVTRYLPSLVASESPELRLFLEEPKTHVVWNAPDGPKMNLAEVLLTRVLFGIDPLGELPDCGSEEATELWSLNVKEKLFVVADQPIEKAVAVGNRPTLVSDGSEVENYGIYYTIRLKGVKTPENERDIGYRHLRQASKAVVSIWTALTAALVGSQHIPAAIAHYLSTPALHTAKFDKSLVIEAQRVCSETWPSLYSEDSEDSTETTNKRGRLVHHVDVERVCKTVKEWKNKGFCNPSVEVVLDEAGNDKKTQIVFISTDAEQALFGLLFARAGLHDGETYQASEFNINLRKTIPVFKAIAYAMLNKEPPHVIVPYDAEAAKQRNKRKASARGDSARAGIGASQALERLESIDEKFNQLEEKMDSIERALDAHVSDWETEKGKAKKARTATNSFFDEMHTRFDEIIATMAKGKKKS